MLLRMNYFNILKQVEGTDGSGGGSITTPCSADLKVIVSFIKGILGLIQIVVPIILIIVGAFDLAKAVMGSDEKEIKAATQKLIKRAIAAVSVFFLSTAVQVIMHYVANSRGERDDQQEWLSCWKTAG